ncbi:DUF2202 domain-containing protein [Alcanivorax sp. 1008]|uniref:DUF2202 domain-containing protein n=1 Tax=Alcanivorax sp. 1008 TaxID=2816853 RepID=UPI001DCC6856|nr:DUF2202 domain-containing protein [Alcanivorax sp. 1008]MCC1497320.1 DUF2202 domain-containing protein [Alcanivorax sp. 1008]
MKKILTSAALASALILATAAMAAPAGQKKSSSSGLTQAEIANLQFMREEEKLARDVYLIMDQYWGQQTSVFANIAVSEESHTSTINYLLEKYDIEDPVISNEIGVFTNPELQELYHTLVEQGSISLVDGLYVGALIEEVDMEDIVAAIDATDERAMILAYSNLLDGSKSHLRGFVDVIEAQGLVYEAQVLDEDEVQLILESEDH